MKCPVSILLCAVLLVPLTSAGIHGAAADNIALGKPYEFSTPPLYGTCADDGDLTQLTDGVSATADWTIPETVGWVHKGRVEVTIDLGNTQPVGRVAFVASRGATTPSRSLTRFPPRSNRPLEPRQEER